ncbi:uncharacterized protein EAF02_002609 [Botrytis sinoallii]|uniref:uncharacterized protein n=1 Tax=Botrytis sinoallii TaxID=1463999 RepID=UPI0019002DCF|nr:uncharacterized protein EAF02_002609 [Botrytis sinoallii]KAF7888068.1 hypothetical protein EAF02_002609 [Botrytis sinoallii]
MPRIKPPTHKTPSKSKSKSHKPSLPTPPKPKRNKNSYSNGALKPIFSGCKMSLAGDFIAEHPGPNAESQWNYEKIGKWITVHGGEYAREVDEYTTHLIVTIKEYKKKGTQVRKAMAMGKRCHIVVIDWLVDCLTLKTNKKRKLVVTGYTLGRVIRRLHHTEDQKTKYRQRFEENVKASKELCDDRLNHVYIDQTNFEYKVVLTRVLLHGKNKNQKYTVYLFESNAQPHTYMAGAKLTTAYQSPSYLREDCRPKIFADAFLDFKNIFKSKTGIEWDDRYEPLLENHPGDLFRFQRPTLGRPMGMLPSWRKAPSWKDIDSGSIPHETGVDSCGEEIQDRDKAAKDESSEVEKKERENERRKERMMMMEKTQAIEERKRKEEFEYDSDSEVDDDEAFDELMRDSVSAPVSTHRRAHLAPLPRMQHGMDVQKETVIVISDSDTEMNSSDLNTEDEEMENPTSPPRTPTTNRISQTQRSFSTSGNSVDDAIIL